MTEYQAIINDELKSGPVVSRRCTDIFCCLLFTIFLTTMFIVGIVGFSKGDPALVLYPYDSSGNQCGRPNKATDSYNYIYYAAAGLSGISNSSNYRVCVKHCPSASVPQIQCYNNSLVSCSSTSPTIYLNVSNTLISTSYYDSNELWKRFCAPNSGLQFFNSVIDDLYVNGIEDWIADISRCWSAMFIVLAISIGVSILYLLLLRYCVGLIVWVTIFATMALLVIFGLHIQIIADNDYGSEDKKKTKEALQIAAICVFVAVGLFFLVFLFLYRRIQLAIAVMKSGAIFLKDVPSIVFVPLIMFAISFGFFTYWVFAIVFIYSSGNLKQTNSVVARISWDDSTRNSLYFEIIGILWINSMKIAVTQFIIACTVCFWYFAKEKNGIQFIKTSAYYAFRYHFGTLAFGSLLLSLIRFIKYVLWYMREKLYKKSEDHNFCLACCCRYVQCYVDCFERFVKFIDKHAFIQTALTGESFCPAAKNAFAIIFENAARFLALGAIGDIFKILGKIFITCVCSLLGFLIITSVEPYKGDIQSPIAPTCVFALISYIVAGIFMSIHEMACDTIIQVYLIDEKLHSNNVQFAPGPLIEFMKEHKDKEHKTCCFGCL